MNKLELLAKTSELEVSESFSENQPSLSQLDIDEDVTHPPEQISARPEAELEDREATKQSCLEGDTTIEGNTENITDFLSPNAVPVSYTHLTLPTSAIV